MANIPQFTKDPNEKLDYFFDWSSWLGTDTINSISVTSSPGITIVSTSNTATSVTAWISGGTSGTPYQITCQVTTTAGRIAERSIILQIENR